MSDIDNNKATDTGNGEGENSQAGAGQETDKKPVTTDTGSEDAGKGEGQGGEGAKDTSKGNDQAKAPNDKDTSKDDEDKDDGVEPVVRKRMSTQDFIIGRQKAKLAKAQAKAGAEDDEDKGKDTDTDEDVAPEDEALINRVVAKTFAPILDKTIQAEDDKEVQDFLIANPDFKPFEAQARRYMAHPSRRHLPVQTIFYEVAGNKLLKIGADRARKADKEAKDTQTGGGSNRAGEGSKNVWDMTTEEFEQEKMRVRQANRN